MLISGISAILYIFHLVANTVGRWLAADASVVIPALAEGMIAVGALFLLIIGCFTRKRGVLVVYFFIMVLLLLFFSFIVKFYEICF